MSPLQVDTQYRGAHASHVEPHYKLGSHRTILTEALPLLNWLIDDSDVNQVVLGKLAHASGVAYTPRVECKVDGQNVTVLLVNKSAAQGLALNARSSEAAKAVAARIRARWEADVAGKPMLRGVE